MYRRILICLAVVAVCNVQAEVITIFDSNATISSSDTYDTVVVKGDSTVVDMTGGAVTKLITMNSSTFNMSDGAVNNVISYDTSEFNMTGGNTSYITSFGTSELNLSGGTTGAIQPCGESRINASGNVSTGTISVCDMPTITISEDAVINDITVWKDGESTINIAGGTINSNIWAQTGTPEITISGGVINGYLSLDVSTGWSSKVNIVGYGLEAVPYGGANEDGQITGYWNDDTSFSIDLHSPEVYSHVVLYDGVIPPTCLSKPESDLSGDCKVDNIDLAKMASEWLADGTE